MQRKVSDLEDKYRRHQSAFKVEQENFSKRSDPFLHSVGDDTSSKLTRDFKSFEQNAFGFSRGQEEKHLQALVQAEKQSSQEEIRIRASISQRKDMLAAQQKGMEHVSEIISDLRGITEDAKTELLLQGG